MSWLSGALGAGISALSSVFGSVQSNKQIDKQLKAQAEENRKTREYNLMLAQQQNQWNQEQWERENEYNSPVNQLKRYREAGLNPDLMYSNGSSGNATQLSGGLTAGEPASPVDYSALGQKMTVGQVVQQTLQNDLVRAQIDKIQAEAQGARGNARLTDIQVETEEILRNVGASEDYVNTILSSPEFENGVMSNPNVRKRLLELKQMYDDVNMNVIERGNKSADSEYKRIQNTFASRQFEALVSKLEHEVDISKQEARWLLETFALRKAGLQAEVSVAETDASFKSLDKIMDTSKGFGAFLQSLISVIRMIFPADK